MSLLLHDEKRGLDVSVIKIVEKALERAEKEKALQDPEQQQGTDNSEPSELPKEPEQHKEEITLQETESEETSQEEPPQKEEPKQEPATSELLRPPEEPEQDIDKWFKGYTGVPDDALLSANKQTIEFNQESLKNENGIIRTLPIKKTEITSKLPIVFEKLDANLNMLRIYAESIFTKQIDPKYSKEPDSLPLKSLTITFSLNEYARLRGRNIDNKHTRYRFRKELENYLHVLHNFGVKFEQPYGKLQKTIFEFWLFESCGIDERNNITITLGKQYALYLLRNNLIARYPTALFKLDPSKEENAFRLGILIAQRATMNKNFRDPSNLSYNVWSVKSILSDLSYKEHNNHYGWYDRYYKQIDNLLERYVDIGFIYEYQWEDMNHNPCTDVELKNCVKSYEDFLKCFVRFKIHTEDEEQQLIQEANTRKQKQEANDKKQQKKENAKNRKKTAQKANS